MAERTVGRVFKSALAAEGLQQQDVPELTGLYPHTVSDIANDKLPELGLAGARALVRRCAAARDAKDEAQPAPNGAAA